MVPLTVLLLAPYRELVQAVAQNNVVMVTWANHHYLDFVTNWVEHVQALGVRAYIVGAMDEKLLQELVDRHIHVFAMQTGLPTGDLGWGSKAFINRVGTCTNMCLSCKQGSGDPGWGADAFINQQDMHVCCMVTRSLNTGWHCAHLIWPASSTKHTDALWKTVLDLHAVTVTCNAMRGAAQAPSLYRRRGC